MPREATPGQTVAGARRCRDLTARPPFLISHSDGCGRDTLGTNFSERRSMTRSHRPPFTTAPVADSQRSFRPAVISTSARADSQRRWLPSLSSRNPSNAMDDLYDLMLAMLGVVVAAVMLVGGELYLVTRPDPPEIRSQPSSVVTSSLEWQPR